VKTRPRTSRVQGQGKRPWPTYILGQVQWRREHTILVLIAFIISLWVNVIFILGAPFYFKQVAQVQEENALEVEILDPIQQFVEVNPSIEEQEPEESHYFSFRGQKAAQPDVPDEVKDADPLLKGDMVEAHKIVQGNVEQVAASAQQTTMPQVQQHSERKELMQDEGDTTIQPPEQTKPWQEVAQEQRPRPRVVETTVMGPLKTSATGVHNVGVLAVNAKFSEFGAYLQRMNEVIASQWTRLVGQFRLPLSDRGTYVFIAFKINAEGEVVELDVLEATASSPAVLACKDAILSRAPYGPWTESMRSTLEEPEALRVKFHYL